MKGIQCKQWQLIQYLLVYHLHPANRKAPYIIFCAYFNLSEEKAQTQQNVFLQQLIWVLTY